MPIMLHAWCIQDSFIFLPNSCDGYRWLTTIQINRKCRMVMVIILQVLAHIHMNTNNYFYLFSKLPVADMLKKYWINYAVITHSKYTIWKRLHVILRRGIYKADEKCKRELLPLQNTATWVEYRYIDCERFRCGAVLLEESYIYDNEMLGVNKLTSAGKIARRPIWWAFLKWNRYVSI